MTDPRTELHDPTTPAGRLAELAQQHPELGPEIAAHPNAYDGLRQWIAQYAPPAQHVGPSQPANPGQPAEAAQFTGPEQPAPEHPQQGLYPQHDAHPQYPQQGFDAPAQALGASLQTPPGAPFGAGPQAPFQTAPGFQSAEGNGMNGVDGDTGRSRRKKALLITLSAVLVSVLALGGGAWWFFDSRLGGSSSPQAATMKLVGGLSSMDPLTLYGSMAPSEFSAFRPSLERLASVNLEGSERSAEQTIAELRRAVSIDAVGLETVVEPIIEGSVERVIFTDGLITLDGDEQQIAGLITDLFRAGAGELLSADELTRMEADMLRDLDLPATLDLRKLADESPSGGIGFITVREGKGWYISPMLSYADNGYRAAMHYSETPYELGDRIIDGRASATPEEAVAATASAIAAFDLDSVAERLSLAERRLYSIYLMPAYRSLDQRSRDMFSLGGQDSFEIIEQSYRAETQGARARVTIEVFEFEAGDRDSYSGLIDVRIERGCVVYSTVSDYSGGTLVETCPLETNWVGEFGLDDLALITVQEQGGWFFSPTATFADALAVITEHAIPLIEQNRLDRALEQAQREIESQMQDIDRQVRY